MKRFAVGATLILTVGMCLVALSMDGPIGLLCSGDSTSYSTGYSDRKFRRIGVGMSAQELEALMGPALYSFADANGDRSIAYSWRTSPRGWYRARSVFLSSGFVARVSSSCTDD